VPNFSLNPFQSPLTKLLSEITPSARENAKVDKTVQELKKQLQQWSDQQKLPPLDKNVILLVGSHYRGTDLSPLKHIDLFLLLDPQHVSIQERGNTITLTGEVPILSECTDESKHLLPKKLIGKLESVFAEQFSTKTSFSGQAIKIQFEKEKMEVRLTPAFATGQSYVIPQEKSELLWRKVSPEKEKEKLEKVNAAHKGQIIPLIRCMKFWNESKNNECFRNFHVEATAYFIFEEIPTPVASLLEAMKLYTSQLTKYIYNCPDPTGLDAPIHAYLPDNIDQWYMFMNRIAQLKMAIESGERSVVELLKQVNS
jgi:hypothetical protein